MEARRRGWNRYADAYEVIAMKMELNGSKYKCKRMIWSIDGMLSENYYIGWERYKAKSVEKRYMYDAIRESGVYITIDNRETDEKHND